MIVAIDGLAGSGKGTLARKLSIHLHVPHLDSGKLYRYVALLGHDLQVQPSEIDKVGLLVSDLAISDLDNPRLSSGLAGALAAKYSPIPAVREKISGLIRDFAEHSKGAVIDGRDIGTVVLPHADVKLYVTASPEVRAMRRVAELRAIGHEASFDKIFEELKERDRADIEREISPLKPARDAHVLDTTRLDVDATFAAAVAVVEAARQGYGHGEHDHCG
jgi:CMP/dCMP kinase